MMGFSLFQFSLYFSIHLNKMIILLKAMQHKKAIYKNLTILLSPKTKYNT